MQTLYEWDFHGRDTTGLDAFLGKNVAEFGPGMEDAAFPAELVHGVADHLQEIDTIIEKAAPEWPIPQIAMVDRNILRIGLYELLFGDYRAVPPKVAINEAIELAKSFGGESSGKFVNGVLGTVYREIGEPGKEHPRRGGEEARRAGAEAPQTEDYVGAVIFRREGDQVYWAMVRDISHHWTFVKGHRWPDETPEEAVLREVREEVGIGGETVVLLGENTYPATTGEGERVLRRVTYFLVETRDSELALEENPGLTEARWFPLAEVKATKHYPDTDHIIAAAMEHIAKMTES